MAVGASLPQSVAADARPVLLARDSWVQQQPHHVHMPLRRSHPERGAVPRIGARAVLLARHHRVKQQTRNVGTAVVCRCPQRVAVVRICFRSMLLSG
eukprot:366052-Chlamydomonas_euryale.AAC.29